MIGSNLPALLTRRNGAEVNANCCSPLLDSSRNISSHSKPPLPVAAASTAATMPHRPSPTAEAFGGGITRRPQNFCNLLPATSSSLSAAAPTAVVTPNEIASADDQNLEQKSGLSSAPPKTMTTPTSSYPLSHGVLHQNDAVTLPNASSSSFAKAVSYDEQRRRCVVDGEEERGGGTSSSTPGFDSPRIVLRQKPAVPPKPQLDIVRFSMAQARDEMDLDTILSELLELENQLNTDVGGDQLLLGLPSIASSSKRHHDTNTNNAPDFVQKFGFPASGMKYSSSISSSSSNNKTAFSAMATIGQRPLSPNSGRATQNFDGRQTGQISSSSSSILHHQQQAAAIPTSSASPPHRSNNNHGGYMSPADTDSAYGDSASTESGGSRSNVIVAFSNGGPPSSGPPSGSGGHNHHSSAEFSGTNSYRGSLDTPSPNQQQGQDSALHCLSSLQAIINQQQYQPMPNQIAPALNKNANARPPSSVASSSSLAEDTKKQKIREALEKMKEAKMKKVYVKIFLEDGSSRGILVDERWTAADTMRHLAEKLNISLAPEHAIVEEYPHLYIKRLYEDHELVVENLEEWATESKNVLRFACVPDKFTFVHQPQQFLLTEKTIDEFGGLTPDSSEWDHKRKGDLIAKFLEEEKASGVPRIPELEGWLLLKADGKKSWKKHYFVLRSSGLYYDPKGKLRGAKDLQCLMTVWNNQIYTCIDWKKKHKAPTNFGFAIKHPRIQTKTSKYIKYICTDDEKSLQQWVTALRIIKNKFSTLHKNYTKLAASSSKPSRAPSVAKWVGVPHISMQRISELRESAMDLSGSCSNGGGKTKHVSPQLEKLVLPTSPTRQQPLLHSRSTNGSHSMLDAQSACTPSSFTSSSAFDHPDFNTIKRQPLTSHEPSTILSGNKTNGSLQSFAVACPSLNFFGNSTNNNPAQKPNKNREETTIDSDEELPPPPPLEIEAILTTPREIISSRKTFVGAQSPKVPPAVRPKPVGFSIFNAQSPASSNPLQTAPPPPLPKRAETTRLQSPNSGRASTLNSPVGLPSQQLSALHASLFAELQKAQTKLRTE